MWRADTRLIKIPVEHERAASSQAHTQETFRCLLRDGKCGVLTYIVHPGGPARPSLLPKNASRCAADVALSCVAARKSQISDEVARGKAGREAFPLAVVQTTSEKIRLDASCMHVQTTGGAFHTHTHTHVVTRSHTLCMLLLPLLSAVFPSRVYFHLGLLPQRC